MSNPIICQAEDQGGWPACSEVATWKTKKEINEDLHREKPYYVCDLHKKDDRWHSEDCFEPIE